MQSDAPHYRKADNPKEFCSNCKYASKIRPTGGHCDLYHFEYKHGYVCDSWSPRGHSMLGKPK